MTQEILIFLSREPFMQGYCSPDLRPRRNSLEERVLEKPVSPAVSAPVSELIAALNWNNSQLGPMTEWPQCLKAVLDLALPSQAQIVLFWGDDFIALYNDAYAPTIGAKHPAAFGQPASEHWSELWDDLEPLLRRVLDGGETVAAKDRPFNLERHGYPETVYFDISYSPIRNEAGKVAGVLCIVSETTERVKFESALRASEERLKAVVSQSAAGIALSNLSGKLISANKRFCEIIGYDEAELVGRAVSELTYPDDLQANDDMFAHMLQTGERFDIETRYVRKDGSVVWVACSVSPLRDDQGQIREAAAVVFDITERKRAQEIERRLAAIIASSNDAILGIDLNMRITSWNNGAAKLYGYSAAEAIGQSVLMLVPSDRLEEEPAILKKVSAGRMVEPYETKRRRKDGRLVDVLLSVSPIYDAAGVPVGASKIAHDIAARKEAERLQSVLVRELSHRVKNLLSTVLAIARQTLGRNEANRSDVAAFEARLASLARAQDLLLTGDWEKSDLRSVVTQALSPYSPERFQLTGAPLPLAAKTVLSLSLALHELATNAAKYGALSVPEGRVAIDWKTDSQGMLELVWRETGGPPVMPPSRRGFGSRLVEMLLSAELNGELKIIYKPQGVLCRISGRLDPGNDL